MKIAIALVVLLLLPALPAAAQTSYRVQKLAEGVYAALTTAGSSASSNAFFVEGRDFVAAGGAHMTKEAIADLVAAVAAVTAKPIRYFILSHHHGGFSHIDFDFPPEIELVMSAQTWQVLSGEVRKITNPVLLFSEGLSLRLGGQTLVLTNLEQGHSEGDLAVYLPEAEILYAGDLLYVDSIGYMGEGHMRSWIMALEFLGQLEARQIIPGSGPMGGTRELNAFKDFMRDFLSEVLAHLERGETREQTLAGFSLPKYRKVPGYDRFLQINVERAYLDLKQELAD